MLLSSAHRHAVLLSLSLVAAAAIAVTVQAQGAAPFTIETLASPSGANAMSPQLTATNGRLVLSWLERGAQVTLKFAERTPAGWSAARIVVSSPKLIANAADVPTVRLLPDGSFLAHWTEENGDDPEASTLRVSVSRDGHHWSAASTPYRDASESQHGFGSAFSLPGATGGAARNGSANGGGPAISGIAWLDGRQEDGMAVRAAVFGADGKARAEAIVDDRVCECCPLATAQSADGPLVVFRNRSAAEVRDIYLSRFEGGRWTPASLVHKDDWTIKACPVNGPAITAAGNNVAVAWFTAAGGKGRTQVAFSPDAGRTFAPPIRVDDQESLGRVSVDWLDDSTAAVGWIEFANNRSLFQVRRVAKDGTRSAAVTVAESGRSQYPRLAHTAAEVVFAWTENTRGTTVVHNRAGGAQAAVSRGSGPEALTITAAGRSWAGSADDR